MRVLWLAALLTCSSLCSTCPVAAHSEDIPIRLQVAGAEIRSNTSSVVVDDEILVPLEILPSLGLSGEIAKDRVRITSQPPATGPGRELRLVRRKGAKFLSLQEVAQLVDGVVSRPALTAKNMSPVPVKPGDWVYLLAQVRSVKLVDGVVAVDTSFPIPVRTGTLETSKTLQDFVECVGAALPAQFSPEPLPDGERRIRALKVEQVKPDVVRIRLELLAPPTGDSEKSGTQPSPPLELHELLRQVQSNFPKLAAADAVRRIAAAKALEKAGAFDPFLNAGTDYIRYPDSDTPGKLKSFSTTDAAVELLTPYGVKVVTGMRLNRGSVKSPLSLTGGSGEYFVGLKLPLLGGAGINEKSAALRQSRLGIPLANSEFTQVRLELLLKAANSYWDWVAAGQRREVSRNLLSLAQTRAKAVKERAEAGDLPLIDVTEADLEVQRRVEGLEKAERELQKEAFKLSLFLWESDGRPAPLPSPRSIPPLLEPAGVLSETEVERGRSLALQQRPELLALDATRQITQVSLDLARNARLPAVELTVIPGLDTGTDGAGGTLKAGIRLGLPLRQRTAEGRIQEAKLKLDKLEQDQQLERQRIVTEVADAESAVRQTYQRHAAAAEELELARKLEQGERDRFALGDSTLFLVNQRERATAEAALKVITLRAEYEQARALFQAVTAQL